MSPVEATAVVAAVAAGACAQTVTGIGLVLICGPLLVSALGPGDGVRLALVVSLTLNLALLARSGRAVRVLDACRLFVPAALVTVPLVAVLRHADTSAAAGAAGGAVVLAALVLATGQRWPWLATPTGTVFAGAASGAMNTLSAVGGPVAALYATNAGWPARTAPVTLQAYFAALNVVALATLGPPSRAALLLPAGVGLAVGLAAGHLLARRASPSGVRVGVLVLAGCGGLAVLIQAAA